MTITLVVQGRVQPCDGVMVVVPEVVPGTVVVTAVPGGCEVFREIVVPMMLVELDVLVVVALVWLDLREGQVTANGVSTMTVTGPEQGVNVVDEVVLPVQGIVVVIVNVGGGAEVGTQGCSIARHAATRK